VGNLNKDEDEGGAKVNGELVFTADSAAVVLTAAEELPLAPADGKRGFEVGKSEDWLGSDGFGGAKLDRGAKGLGFALDAPDVALEKLPPENVEEN